MLNWYLENGKDSDVVMSTRVRIARNIKNVPFFIKSSGKDKEKVIEMIKKIYPSIGYGLKFIRLKDMDDITKMTLVERHLISPDFVLKQSEYGAILINDEENICIMINEEDHIRVQVFSSGLEIQNVKDLAVEVEEKIGEQIGYAYNNKYGFLTSCPSNVGTGCRISVMVHLPALTKTGNIRKGVRSCK